MKEKFLTRFVKLGFILFLIFGAFLFIVSTDWRASFYSPEDKVAIFGIGISIVGSLLFWLLLGLGEKIKFLNNFLKKPLVEKVIRGLAKVFTIIFVSIVLWGLLKDLFTN